MDLDLCGILKKNWALHFLSLYLLFLLFFPLPRFLTESVVVRICAFVRAWAGPRAHPSCVPISRAPLTGRTSVFLSGLLFVLNLGDIARNSLPFTAIQRGESGRNVGRNLHAKAKARVELERHRIWFPPICHSRCINVVVFLFFYFFTFFAFVSRLMKTFHSF